MSDDVRCDTCMQVIKEVMGFEPDNTERQVMGHYCPHCIIYKRKDNGHSEKARVVGQPES